MKKFAWPAEAAAAAAAETVSMHEEDDEDDPVGAYEKKLASPMEATDESGDRCVAYPLEPLVWLLFMFAPPPKSGELLALLLEHLELGDGDEVGALLLLLLGDGGEPSSLSLSVDCALVSAFMV